MEGRGTGFGSGASVGSGIGVGSGTGVVFNSFFNSCSASVIAFCVFSTSNCLESTELCNVVKS